MLTPSARTYFHAPSRSFYNRVPGKSSASKASGWRSCKLCSKLPSGDSYDVFQDDGYKADYSHLERPADSREQLIELIVKLKLQRCPVCHTYYLSSNESDPHHFMSEIMSIDRVSDEVALRELTSIKTATAKEWLHELRTKLGKSPKASKAPKRNKK